MKSLNKTFQIWKFKCNIFQRVVALVTSLLWKAFKGPWHSGGDYSPKIIEAFLGPHERGAKLIFVGFWRCHFV